MKITLQNGDEVIAALNRLASTLKPGGLRPALLEIGEALSATTKQRFVSGTDPEGNRWEPNAASTYLAYLAGRNRSGRLTRKDGRINAAGAATVSGKKPLVDSGLLAGTITWQLTASGTGVEIGTNRFAGEWEGGAAVHQFGSKDGRIPARPFLGLSSADEANVLDILERYLRGEIGI